MRDKQQYKSLFKTKNHYQNIITMQNIPYPLSIQFYRTNIKTKKKNAKKP